MTLFNLPHWQTAGLVPQNLASQQTLVQDEAVAIDLDPALDIQTLRISANRSCQLTLGLYDKGSAYTPTELEREIYIDVPATQYLQLHAYGDVSRLSLRLDKLLDPQYAKLVTEESPGIVSYSVVANAPIPLSISPLRIVTIIGMAALIWAFLPRRRMYRIPAFQPTEPRSGSRPTEANAVERTSSPSAQTPLAADTHKGAGGTFSMHLAPIAKRVLAGVTALLCVLALLPLGIVPGKLGEFGVGYSTVSTHEWNNEVRAATKALEKDNANADEAASTGAQDDTAAAPDEGAETESSTEAKETDEGAEAESDGGAQGASKVATGSASKAETLPYIDESPLAFLYSATYESELAKLARAFAAGQLHLLDEPYPEFFEMNNPYDPSERAIAIGGEASYYWDTAYYDGKFYVYFGALPVVVFYLPYFLITGQDLPNFIPIALCLVAVLIGLTMLLVQIARRWFPRVSLGILLLALLLVVFGAQLGWLTLLPSIYEVPVAMALALLVWAAVCLVSTGRHPRLAIVGAFLVALILACRPQIVLFGLLLVPFGIKAMLAKPTLRARLLYVGAALAPVVVVLALIGAYNAARFGSPIDFGAAYNLTTNDMRFRPMSIDMALISVFSYLFQLPSIAPHFPLLQPLATLAHSGTDAIITMQETWGYAGKVIVEAPIGGLLWLSPLVWFVLAFFAKKPANQASPDKATAPEMMPALGRTSTEPESAVDLMAARTEPADETCVACDRSDNRLQRIVGRLVSWKAFAVLVIVLTLAVVIIDGEGAGILPRYVLDFALPPLVLGAAGLMLLEARGSRWIVPIGVVMLVIGVVVTVAIAFHENMINLTWNYQIAQMLAELRHLLF